VDRRLLDTYNRELQHVREVGAEFARDFPKIAGRLGLEGFECADPYVERLLEGFAFLAARIQLKIDAGFPRFTQHLLETIYPGYLAPVPSMAMVQFHPDPSEGSLAAGVTVPRDTALRSIIGKGEQTACEYRTAHDVTLWPIEVAEVEYFRYSGAASAIGIPALPGVKAGLRIRLRTTGGLRFDQLALDRLVLHLLGAEELPMQLYEQLLANAVAVVARPARIPPPWMEVLERSSVGEVGFEDREALLPNGPRAFSGHRLLNEYFAFPSRFLFVALSGLSRAVKRCAETEMDVIVLMNRSEPSLEGAVSASNLGLFCSPAINLFPRRADRIDLSDSAHEYHVVPDRTRPLDLEVYDLQEVTGYGVSGEREREFLPFYASTERTPDADRGAYYAMRRTPRLRADSNGGEPRSNYLGGEVFLSLVDGNEAPWQGDLRQVAVSVLCTNRDLPLLMSIGGGRTDFTMTSGAPVRAVRCLGTPTPPRPPLAEGGAAWRLVSHLSLNYLSLMDADQKVGAAALREILSLYADVADSAVRKQIEGLKTVTAKPVLRRVPSGGPISFGRGLQIEITFDEAAFRGTGVFLLGAVLEQFLARYVSINSFTETIIRTLDRGEIARWPARAGQRPIL
jgi:type VI secretion system protein ImpG